MSSEQKKSVVWTKKVWSGQKRCGLEKKVWSGQKRCGLDKKVWSGQKRCGLDKKRCGLAKKGVVWTKKVWSGQKKCDLSKIKDIRIRKSELATENQFFLKITMGLYT